MKFRTPVVAGSFYPESPQQLSEDIQAFLVSVEPKNVPVIGIIVPHAGYTYSGKIAASAYCLLSAYANKFKTVVLVGPCHRYALQGCAVPDVQAFVTPLGAVNVNQKLCQQLTTNQLAIASEQAHLWEHSLEVQLPFLQQTLSDFDIVPVVVGQSDPAEVARLLQQLCVEPEVLLVVTTDLSHYQQYQQANLLDQQTIKIIEALNPILTPEQACGCNAINGLLYFCQLKGLKLTLLSQANSGDAKKTEANVAQVTAIRQSKGQQGNKNAVVGYASFVIH